HLTFGLTDGWWLYDDEEMRIPGCPGLSSDTWENVLKEKGFRSILFPAEASHKLGQQIIVAESDGIIRLTNKPNEPIKEKNEKGKELDESTTSVSTTKTEDYIADVVLGQVSEALKMNQAEIDKNLSFAEYGVDSIIGVRLIQAIN